jgi:hypothetical protein
MAGSCRHGKRPLLTIGPTYKSLVCCKADSRCVARFLESGCRGERVSTLGLHNGGARGGRGCPVLMSVGTRIARGLIAVSRWIVGSGAILEIASGYVGKSSPMLAQYLLWPKHVDAVTARVRDRPASDLIGIVVQGPWVEDGRFTADTLLRYRAAFPSAAIVYSGWLEDELASRGTSRALADAWQFSERPQNPGPANINLQMKSASAGISQARELGCTHVLKTRSDQRLYSLDALTLLKRSLDAFPANIEGESETGRLVVTSLNSFRYRMYGPSDMLTFGAASDVARYWNAPEDTRAQDFVGNSARLSVAEHSRLKIAEVYLATTYLESCGVPLEWTLDHSLQVLRDFFCVVDASQLGLYWPKYTLNADRWAEHVMGPDFREMTFASWLDLWCATAVELDDADNNALQRDATWREDSHE